MDFSRVVLLCIANKALSEHITVMEGYHNFDQSEYAMLFSAIADRYSHYQIKIQCPGPVKLDMAKESITLRGSYVPAKNPDALSRIRFPQLHSEDMYFGVSETEALSVRPLLDNPLSLTLNKHHDLTITHKSIGRVGCVDLRHYREMFEPMEVTIE